MFELPNTQTLLMRSFLLPILLCVYCCTLAHSNVRISADPGWLYKNPVLSGRTPAANTIGSGYYLELADQQVNLVTNTNYTHIIRNIVNTSGVQNASEVSVTFSPSFQQVTFHKVVIIRNGAEINQLKENTIRVVEDETETDNFQYTGLRRAFVILKDVHQGDRIEFAYSVTGFNPVFANKYADMLYFYNTNPIANYFITIIAPASRKLLFKPFNQAPAPQESLQGGNRVYHWDNPPVQVMASESGTPSWYNQYPYTSVTEFGSWEEVIHWGLDLFRHYKFPLPPALQAQIAAWRKTAKGDKDLFADLATHFVQDEVRYLGLEIGTYTHQPHTPADVYLHRFGDCKDKALLLASILQQENIPAYVALVNTGTRHKLEEAAPSASEFDHAIVAIDRPERPGYIYIDATVNLQRGHLASRFIPAYGYALVLREGQTGLQPVTPGFRYGVSIEESMHVHFNDSTRFKIITSYSGGAADNMRGYVSNASLKDIEDEYRQLYAKAYEGIQSHRPIELKDDSAENRYTVTETYSIPDVWHADEKGRKAFDVFARPVYDRLPDPTGVPAGAPLAITFPRRLDYLLDLYMPEEWGFSPEAWHTKTDTYEFDFTPETKDNHISLRYSFQTFRDYVPAEELARYKTDYKKMVDLVEFSLSYGGYASSPPVSSSPPAKSFSLTGWTGIWLLFGLGLLLTVVLKGLPAWMLRLRRRRDDYR